MARRKAAIRTGDETQPIQPATDAALEHASHSVQDRTDFPFGALAPAPADAVPSSPEPVATSVPPAEAPAPDPEAKPGSRPHVRSWSRDLVLGYQVLTDDRLKLIVLRFDDRPADAVLAAVKDKGFKYRELREHGRVWVTPNDWEGRTLTDQLEQELYRYRTGQERATQGVA